MASQSPMLARNSSEIQPARTGTAGSARAAGSVVSWPAAMASSKAVPFPAIGGNAHRSPVFLIDQVIFREPLGKFAGLGVPEPDAVADGEPVRRVARHRGLHLARSLDLGQLQPGGPERLWQPVRCPR